MTDCPPFSWRRLRLIKIPACGLKLSSGRAALRKRQPQMKITRRMNEKTRRYIEVR